MTLNIEQERLEFVAAVRAQTRSVIPLSDEQILQNCVLVESKMFHGWLAAKRATMGSAEAVKIHQFNVRPERKWMDMGADAVAAGEFGKWNHCDYRIVYTAPPSSDAKEPISATELRHIWRDIADGDTFAVDFARAVEARHGIHAAKGPK